MYVFPLMAQQWIRVPFFRHHFKFNMQSTYRTVLVSTETSPTYTVHRALAHPQGLLRIMERGDSIVVYARGPTLPPSGKNTIGGYVSAVMLYKPPVYVQDEFIYCLNWVNILPISYYCVVYTPDLPYLGHIRPSQQPRAPNRPDMYSYPH